MADGLVVGTRGLVEVLGIGGIDAKRSDRSWRWYHGETGVKLRVIGVREEGTGGFLDWGWLCSD